MDLKGASEVNKANASSSLRIGVVATVAETVGNRRNDAAPHGLGDRGYPKIKH